MKLHFSKSNQILQCNSRSIPAWCKVRNELNGLRKVDEVVFTEPVEHPYYPRRFPSGTWNISRPERRDNPYLFPFFIPTDAWQMVELWSVKDGKYCKRTGAQYRDAGYGIHFSTSMTTLGCIRIGSQKDLEWMVEQITEAIDTDEKVMIEVVD